MSEQDETRDGAQDSTKQAGDDGQDKSGAAGAAGAGGGDAAGDGGEADADAKLASVVEAAVQRALGRRGGDGDDGGDATDDEAAEAGADLKQSEDRLAKVRERIIAVRPKLEAYAKQGDAIAQSQLDQLALIEAQGEDDVAFRRQLVSHLQLQDIPKDDRTDVRKIMRKMDAVGQPVEPMAAHLMLLGVRARRSEQGSGAATTGDEKGGAAKAAATKAKDMEREPDSERVDTSGQDTRRRGKLVTISTDDYDARVSKLRSNGQHEEARALSRRILRVDGGKVVLTGG